MGWVGVVVVFCGKICGKIFSKICGNILNCLMPFKTFACVSLKYRKCLGKFVVKFVVKIAKGRVPKKTVKVWSLTITGGRGSA